MIRLPPILPLPLRAVLRISAVDNRLPVLTFEPLVEQSLLESLRTGDSGTFLAIDPLQAERLAVEVANKAEEAERSEEHTSELQSQSNLVCRLLLEPKLNAWE